MTAQAVRMYFLLYKAGAMPFFVVDYSLGWLKCLSPASFTIKNTVLSPYKKIRNCEIADVKRAF